ncbi:MULTISPECIES: HPr(Ser) kinase/phosphatase [Chitinimonas]|uniref:HPr kinase/phosphorylase n=1 Tax=Chitinimonas prasina TaxID=1434937 RepID=A0ABQ5YJB2_9NEIS|nr:HPr(Ser) kinase/phosphatase [Chitinimonas prasina]MBL8508070.1 HPr kinase/phosphorylase [Chitinimonas sp.]GLR14058.1 HPr kinase/phosphorylase [Chitinimonas prasina]
MPQITVRQLFIDNAEKLRLTWLAGQSGANNLLSNEADNQKPAHALVGHLNFVHPNRIQVLGLAEIAYLQQVEATALKKSLDHLFSTDMAAMIIANGQPAPDMLREACERAHVPLLTSPEQSPYLMDVLRFYLAKALAVSTNLHGVFLDVLEVGVLITGESAMGKSELALELISRGHGLVADDVVELYRIAPDTLEGRCPPLLRDFLEVRGLGVLNIRTIFGETAVRPRKNLKLIIHLTKQAESITPLDRLQMQAATQAVLDVAIRKVVLPVAAGRNLAVLVEAAVRNYILQLRGIDSTREFIERHQRFMESGE